MDSLHTGKSGNMDWTSKTTKVDLADWLQRELGFLPQGIKNEISEQIEEVLRAWNDGGEEDQKEAGEVLLEQAKKYLRVYQLDRVGAAAPVYKAGQGEQEAFDALICYYEGEINTRPDIRHFRKQMEQCGLAFPWVYHDFLERKLFRVLNFERLEQVIVKPFVPADYFVGALSGTAPLSALRFHIWRKTDNSKWDVEHDLCDLMCLQREEALCTSYQDAVYVKGAVYRGHFWGHGGLFGENGSENAQQSRHLTAEEVLNQQVFRCHAAEAFTFRGTVVGRALQIGADVSRDYGLPVEDVLSVLLTGRVHPHSVIQSQVINCPVRLLPEGGKIPQENAPLDYHAVSRISIEAPAWISPTSVAAHVQELQKFIYGNSPYLPKTEHLQLFRFVNDQHIDLPEGEKSPSWETLLELWKNRSAQSNLQPTDRRNFSQVYCRVREKLLPQPPTLRALAWPPSPKASRKKVTKNKSKDLTPADQ